MVHNKKFQPQRFLIFWFLYTGFYCILKVKSKENKVIHAVNWKKCRFVLAVQMFAVSVFRIIF